MQEVIIVRKENIINATYKKFDSLKQPDEIELLLIIKKKKNIHDGSKI